MTVAAVLEYARAQAAGLRRKTSGFDSAAVPLEKELRLAIQMNELDKVTAILTKINEVTTSEDSSNKIAFFNLCLNLAAIYGDPKMISILLEKGAELNARSPQASTPLHRAVSNGNFEAVKYLVTAGADPRAETSTGLTPMKLAELMQHPEISDFLRQLP